MVAQIADNQGGAGTYAANGIPVGARIGGVVPGAFGGGIGGISGNGDASKCLPGIGVGELRNQLIPNAGIGVCRIFIKRRYRERTHQRWLILHRADGDAGGVGGDGKCGGGTVDRDICGAARDAGGCVPGAEGDGGAAVPVGVGDKANLVGGIEQARGAGRRAAKSQPVAPVVHAVLPDAIGVVDRSHGNGFKRNPNAIRVADAAIDNDRRHRVARRAGEIFGNAGEHRRGGGIEHRRTLGRRDLNADGVADAGIGRDAAIAAGAGGVARRATGFVPGAERERGAAVVVAAGNETDFVRVGCGQRAIEQARGGRQIDDTGVGGKVAPPGAVVGAVLPLAVGVVDAGDGNRHHGSAVGVGQAAGGNQAGNRIADRGDVVFDNRSECGRGAGIQHRCIVGSGKVDHQAAGGGGQCTTGALCAAGIAVVKVPVEGDAAGNGVAGIGVGNAAQHAVDGGLRGIGVERNGERAGGLRPGADGNGGHHHIAAGNEAGRKHVERTGAAVASEGEAGAVVVAGREVGIGQRDVGIENQCGVFGVGQRRGEAGKGRGVVNGADAGG